VDEGQDCYHQEQSDGQEEIGILHLERKRERERLQVMRLEKRRR